MNLETLRAAVSVRLHFFVAMVASSVLTLLRGFILAVVLDVADFGLYAIVISVGIFASNLLSFGLVEGFMKLFPRLWLIGENDLLVQKADQALAAVLMRAGFAGIFVTAAAYLSGYQEYLLLGIFSVAVSASAISYNVYAAGIRSTAELRLFGAANLVRAAAALVFGVLGGWLAGWEGAVGGEIAAAILAAVLMRHWLVRLRPSAIAASSSTPPEVATVDYGGYWIFLSIILVSAPLYLDRLFIGNVFGTTVAGTYAFLMLFYMINSTLVAVVIQSVGPQLVRMERSGASFSQQFGTAAAWSAACISAAVLGLAAAAFALFLWPLQELGNKYGITAGAFIAVSVLSFFRISEFLEWFLISRDREKEMTAASFIFFAGTCLTALSVVWYGLTVEHFLWMLALSRSIQFAAQIGFLLRQRN